MEERTTFILNEDKTAFIEKPFNDLKIGDAFYLVENGEYVECEEFGFKKGTILFEVTEVYKNNAELIQKVNVEPAKVSEYRNCKGFPDFHFLFTVLIDNQRMHVYHREEKHEIGKWNNCPENWWLKYVDSDGKFIEWVPWIDNGSHRICWDIRIKEGNRTKVKWDDIGIRGTGVCEMFANDIKVFSFGFVDIGYAFSKAQYLTVVISEHPLNFFNPEEEIGRKIWYKNQPAIIDQFKDGELTIVPDGIKEFDMREAWHEEGDEIWRDDFKNRVRTCPIEDKDIWFFREI